MVLILFAVAIVGCKGINNPFIKKNILARVDDSELRITDVAHIFTEGITPEDSLKALETYVDTWVKSQLKIQEAERLLSDEKMEINKMVEDYRNSLLNLKLDQYWFDHSEQLDETFTNEQIEEYYQKNKSEFLLNRAIVKGLVFKYPKNSRHKAKIESLAKTGSENDRRDIIDICLKNNYYFKEFNQWTDFAEVLTFMPVSDEKKYEPQLKQRTYIDAVDQSGQFCYFVISERLIQGEISPLDVVRDVVNRGLFARQKQEIVRTNEENLYNAAVAAGKVTINLK